MSEHTVLVFGAGGQVGRALCEAPPPGGLSLQGHTRDQTDITDADSVRAAIAAHSPAIVVNAAAYTDVDRAESDRDQAFAVNETGAATVAEACATSSTPLIHISTDFVFDGAKTSAYVESDPVRPLSVYGESKAAGERAVIQGHSASVVLRTAWVYSPWRRNFVRTMLRLGAERDALGVVDDQHGCPTAARDIAGAVLTIAAALANGKSDGFGIFHFCGGGETSWHGFAQEIFACASAHGLPVPKSVRPITTADYPTPAKRPANSVLSCEKVAGVYGMTPPPWRESLATCLKEIAGQRP